LSRIAVYTDYTYRRAGGRIYAERAFALFLLRLAARLDHLVIVGKVDPRSAESHYELTEEVEFLELPYYEALTDPRDVLRAFVRSSIRFWGVLSEVDGVWLLGPHPLAVAFAALAVLRGRAVTLGVRQDFRRYVRARHPNRRWIAAAGDALEAVWTTMSRVFPIVAVGPQLAALYPDSRTLELIVSLVGSEDVRSAGEPLPSYGDGELTALSVGRLEQEKNPLLLADIAAELARSDPRWRLIICGEGPMEDELRRRLATLGVADRVTLRGYVPHDRGLREIYRSSHALLHVSWTEGLPQVLYEAFAARLPTVATAVGGVPAAAGDAALLIGPGDAQGAVAALTRIADDPALRDRLTTAGVARVRAHTLDAEASRVASFLGSTRRRAQWVVRPQERLQK
jgi:glycosyltransferase involved in cell wall biosynthesis